MDNITVKYSKLKKVVQALDSMELDDDSEISFEYIIGSCFPDVLKNIKTEMHTQYTKGYTDGLKEKGV